jgi:hypothetical protein
VIREVWASTPMMAGTEGLCGRRRGLELGDPGWGTWTNGRRQGLRRVCRQSGSCNCAAAVVVWQGRARPGAGAEGIWGGEERGKRGGMQRAGGRRIGVRLPLGDDPGRKLEPQP